MVLNALSIINLDILQLIAEAFSQEYHQLLGSQVSLRDIVFLATCLVTKLLIAIEGI